MDWFRTDAGFSRHRDFLRLRKELALSRPALAGFMVLLFEAVAEHEEYGDLSTTPDEVIEEWVDWPRDRAGQFATALKSVGWIKDDGEFSGWIERHKSMLKARDKKRSERKKRNSKKLRDEKRTSRGTSAGQPPDSRRTAAGRPAADPPYRTVPNQTIPDEKMKDLGAAAPAPKESKPKNNPPATAFVQAYYDAHLEATGAKPIVAWDVTTKLAKAALSAMPLEEGLALLPIYFRDEIEPSASNFFTSWRLEKLRATLRSSAGAQSPLSNDDRRLKVIAAEVARIARLPASPWSFASIPFILGGRVVKVGGTADSQYWSWNDPNNAVAPTKHGDLTVTLHERAKADKIADADLAAWIARTVTARYDMSEYGAA